MNQDVIYSYTFDDDFFRAGTYANGHFDASWDEVIGGWQHKGSLHIVIDAQSQKITQGNIEAEIVSTSNPDNTYERMEIEFTDLPATSWGSTIYFGVTGDDFCNPAIITHFYEESAQLNYWRTLQSYSCSTVNSFAIKLSRTQ